MGGGGRSTFLNSFFFLIKMLWADFVRMQWVVGPTSLRVKPQ